VHSEDQRRNSIKEFGVGRVKKKGWFWGKRGNRGNQCRGGLKKVQPLLHPGCEVGGGGENHEESGRSRQRGRKTGKGKLGREIGLSDLGKVVYETKKRTFLYWGGGKRGEGRRRKKAKEGGKQPKVEGKKKKCL